eukprot:CAMPEP_0113298404 /NCGR_PEP_ID=MMETSP0010_2-20120614/865_1 /TAXON_ID=216773 ORGANISM="Corethron hystrix, Strain 308" /NCGR_SAMPLE_ID=MMETSP0010_2 /ASSEMBLY_ACC=CAM_ASM_000155 /LENGTH=114 /DNA_ID=CAMNT_0000151457 /DNA_START=290 /DNA_END=634 /DNA_ORIENTATION=+ /assembly_acc=CAM_ASM_000155
MPGLGGEASTEGGGFSYVEGTDYGDRAAELEAMGGDSFFLDDEEDDNEGLEDDVVSDERNEIVGTGSSLSSGWKATDGLGPQRDIDTEDLSGGSETTEKWVWDGVEDEGAYFDS